MVPSLADSGKAVLNGSRCPARIQEILFDSFDMKAGDILQWDMTNHGKNPVDAVLIFLDPCIPALVGLLNGQIMVFKEILKGDIPHLFNFSRFQFGPLPVKLSLLRCQRHLFFFIQGFRPGSGPPIRFDLCH